MTKVSFQIIFYQLKIDFEKLKLIFVFGKFFEKSLLTKSSHFNIMSNLIIYIFTVRFIKNIKLFLKHTTLLQHYQTDPKTLSKNSYVLDIYFVKIGTSINNSINDDQA